MTESREAQRRRQFRDRAKIRPAAAPAPAPAAVPARLELCIIETPAQCSRPRLKGSQLCAAHDEETDRLAAERLAAGWPS